MGLFVRRMNQRVFVYWHGVTTAECEKQDACRAQSVAWYSGGLFGKKNKPHIPKQGSDTRLEKQFCQIIRA